MARARSKPLRSLLESPRVREAARALVQAVQEELQERDVAPESHARLLRELERQRGQPLEASAVSAGMGRGARVRLADGRTLLDFAGAIGVYGFGHSDPDLLEAAAAAAAGDNVVQGPLLPGLETLRLARALLSHAGSRLRHVWLSASGAMANENALALILQKHAPADRMIVFEGGFAGCTLALTELSDQPTRREGLPLRGSALYVPFFDPADPEGSTRRALAALERHLTRYPGRIAGMHFELIQGEAGVNTAPREFFAALMQRCSDAGLAVWADELQTFGRTQELFAFRSLALEPFVDVASAGNMLQGGAVLFRRSYKPKPGLMAGASVGATTGLAVGARIIERLESEGYLGPEGRIAVLGGRFERRLEALRKRMPRAIGPRTGMGAMQAFEIFDGSHEVTHAVLEAAFQEGLLALDAGANPARVRMLLPVNTSDEELEAAFTILEKVLQRVAEARELPV